MKSLLDIKWIINTLNEENIYEIDPLIVLNDKNNFEFKISKNIDVTSIVWSTYK